MESRTSGYRSSGGRARGHNRSTGLAPSSGSSWSARPAGGTGRCGTDARRCWLPCGGPWPQTVHWPAPSARAHSDSRGPRTGCWSNCLPPYGNGCPLALAVSAAWRVGRVLLRDPCGPRSAAGTRAARLAGHSHALPPQPGVPGLRPPTDDRAVRSGVRERGGRPRRGRGNPGLGDGRVSDRVRRTGQRRRLSAPAGRIRS